MTSLSRPSTVNEGAGVTPGVWFRLGLGGITGHKDFAKSNGVYVEPKDAVAVADAIVRVFIDNGDRTDRKKARLKYVLDSLGFREVPGRGRGEARLSARDDCRRRMCRRRPRRIGRRTSASTSRSNKACLGRRRAAGRKDDNSSRCASWPTSRMSYGDGDIRLTVWQNLLISGIARDAHRASRSSTLRRSGSSAKATSVRAGLVACTGNTGCKLANSNTKDTAIAIADAVRRASRWIPRSIFISPAARTPARSTTSATSACMASACRCAASDDTMDGFHILVGGGFGAEAGIARELYRDVRKEDCPPLIERILRAYLITVRARKPS